MDDYAHIEPVGDKCFHSFTYQPGNKRERFLKKGLTAFIQLHPVCRDRLAGRDFYLARHRDIGLIATHGGPMSVPVVRGSSDVAQDHVVPCKAWARARRLVWANRRPVGRIQTPSVNQGPALNALGD